MRVVFARFLLLDLLSRCMVVSVTVATAWNAQQVFCQTQPVSKPTVNQVIPNTQPKKAPAPMVSSPKSKAAAPNAAPTPLAPKSVQPALPGINFNVQMVGFSAEAPDPDGNPLKFESVCSSFGKELMAAVGPFKRSPISKVDCSSAVDFALEQSDRLKAKVDAQSLQSDKVWSLRIRNLDEAIDFQVQFGTDKNFVVLAQFSFEKVFHPLVILNDKEQRQNVAQMVLKSLPFEAVVSRSEISDMIDLPLRSTSNTESAKEILIYDLRVDGQVLAPVVMATGRLVGADKKVSPTGKWFVTKDASSMASPASAQTSLLFVKRSMQQTEDPLKPVYETIESRQVSMKEAFGSIGKSGYVGFRIGRSFLSSKSDFGESPLVGIFGEFRSGKVSGLKLAYDIFPKVSTSNDTGTRELSWTRFQFGYSFGEKVSFGPINSVDITPRLGITTLDFEFTPVDTDEFTGYSLVQRRAPTVGLEIGAEARKSNLLARAWLYGTYSFGVVTLDRKFRTQSLRGGLDLHAKLVNFGSFKLAGLFFVMTDYVKVGQQSLGDDDDLLAVSELKSWINYVGTGLTLAW